jgi:hypothetical protein
MKKALLITLLLSIFTVGFGQKVKIKKDIIYVDGMEYMTFDKELNGHLFTFTFYNLQGEEVAYADMGEYVDPQKCESANPECKVFFYTVSVEGVEEKCEINNPFNLKKKIAKLFYKANVLKDDKIDLEKANKFIKRKSTPHTTRILQIEEAKKTGTTIIINN